MGKIDRSIITPLFRLAGSKLPRKSPFIGRNSTTREELPARTALQPFAPRRGGLQIAAPLRPQPFSAPALATAAPHPAACPQFLFIIITTKIIITITATVIMEIIARIRGSERQVTKQGRRTGESMPCCCAERCAGAENRRPARGELNAYRFAALPACGGAREGRCNPFCARVAIRVPEKAAAAWATSGERGAGGWRRCIGGCGAPRIPPRARERRRRGAGEVSAQRRRARPRVLGIGTQT